LSREKGVLNKSDVKDFLNEKYAESKAYRARKLILKEVQKINNGYSDECPHCHKLFDVPNSAVQIHDDEKGIYGIMKCPDCGADLIIHFKLDSDIDPLFGGKTTVKIIIEEAGKDE